MATVLGAGPPDQRPRLWQQPVLIGTAAESFHLAFRAAQAVPAEGGVLRFTAGVFGRTLRLSEVLLCNLGTTADPAAVGGSVRAYPGHDGTAPWRTEAERRIDRHRKAGLTVRVTDRLGRPLPGIAVQVEQVRHAYPFGTCVPAARLVDAPRPLVPGPGESEAELRQAFVRDNARLRSEMARLFNCAVLENDLKWPFWSGSKPEMFRQEWTSAGIDQLRQLGLDAKGHTLLWASWKNCPAWLKEHEADHALLQAAILAHIRDQGGAMRGRMRWYDVLNEPMSHNDLIRLLGTDAVAAWFAEARRALPGTQLVINDFDIVGNGGSAIRRAGYLALIKELQDRQAPIDLVGFQGHFWSDRLTAPEEIWRIMDEVHGATGLPLMTCEFDMNLANEAVQAAYTRDYLTAWFAHPASAGFIMWGFWGGTHWFGEAGAMYRRDWTAKPNLAAYEDLVFSRWWTRADLRTAEDGTVALRAFQGDHRLELDGRVQRTVRLPAEGAELTVVLPEAPG